MPFYHGISRKIVGAFGALFSHIYVQRRLENSVTGEIAQTLQVPISYAPKMKWWQMFVENPARAKEMNITLPRMSYEILGYTYDATRKNTRSEPIVCVDEDGAKTMQTPAPWNIEMALYIVGNNSEDVWQIMEQILPLFNPDYTLKIAVVPDMNVVSNVPISLTSVAIQDDYDGDFATHRLVIYTLTFTIKTAIYGEAKPREVIYTVESLVGNGDKQGKYVVKADKDTGEIIIDEWNWDTIMGENTCG